MGGVCWIGSSRGGGGSSDYRVLKGKTELERYDTLAQASKSAYKAQFKELAKIAEAKHKERKTLRKFRLFQIRALKANARTLPDGRSWSQILAEAESGDVPAAGIFPNILKKEEARQISPSCPVHGCVEGCAIEREIPYSGS